MNKNFLGGFMYKYVKNLVENSVMELFPLHNLGKCGWNDFYCTYWPESPQFLCVGAFLPLIFRTHLDSNQNSFFGKCEPCGKQSLLEGRVHVLPEACNLQKGTQNA